MAVTANCNQLAHATPACMVALAIKHEVDGFCRLRPHEGVVEIGSGTQGEIGETVQRIHTRTFAWIVDSVPPCPVFIA